MAATTTHAVSPVRSIATRVRRVAATFLRAVLMVAVAAAIVIPIG